MVPAYVHRIVGCYARIKPRYDTITSEPVWRIAPGGSQPLVMEQLFSEPGGELRATPFILDESDRTVVLRDLLVLAGQAYRGDGPGKVFLENVAGTSSRYWSGLPVPLPEAVPQFAMGSQSVWARQLNAEQKDLKICNDGGRLWILGLKNEEDGTLLQTMNGGRTELLGGTVMPLDVEDTASPGFVIEESSVSLVAAGHAGWSRDLYPLLLRETRNGETRTLTSADASHHRGYTNEHGAAPPVLGLYRGSLLTEAEHWRMNFFGQKENTGTAADDSDPDADGRTNLLERALGTDPLQPDAERSPRLIEWAEADESLLGLEMTVPAGGSLQPNGVYQYGSLSLSLEQASRPNGPWQPVDSPCVRSRLVGDSGDGRFRLRTGMPAQFPLFLRLFVQE